MGKKVWLWIIAALAILVALAVTAAIWMGTLSKNDQKPDEPETSSAQEETTENAPEQSEETTQSSEEADPEAATETEESQQELTDTEETETTFPPPTGENQLPIF